MEVITRPAVLDTGIDAKQHCKLTGTVSLNGITLAFAVYGPGRQQNVQVGAGVDANGGMQTDKVLMIMGFAAAGDAWLPTLNELFSRGEKVAAIEVAVFDNRGIGRSSCPAQKTLYTTDIMAQDALGLMDYLGWQKAHVVGHSMGGMIASRLALVAPERVASLTLISVTGGGSEAIPLNWRAMKAALRGSWAKDPYSRARADLAFHFSPKLLELKDPETGKRVKDTLIDEYVEVAKEVGRQPKHGEQGQLHAVMKHGLTKAELQQLANAGFPIKVIHGSEDILALPRHAARLARLLHAPLIMLDSAHFTPRDCAKEVNDEVLATIEAVRKGCTHADAVHPCPDPILYERISCLVCCG